MSSRSNGSATTGTLAFIGRSEELAAFDRALEATRAGGGRIVMLGGEPGIGKTRTAQQVAEHAAAAGMLVLWGRCPEEPGAPPYWPWLQVIRRYAAAHDDATLRTVIGPAAGALAGLDPQLGHRLGELAPALPADADAAQARFQLFDAITGFWQRAAAGQPLLLVFDDLHCADTASLRLLEFVARELGASRLMIVGTFREAELTRAHPLSDTLAALGRHAGMQRLRLAGFSEPETAEFIGAFGSSVPSSLAAALHERTDGHPLFLAETTRYLDEARQAAGGPPSPADLRRVPSGVREVIGSRLNRLAPPCGHALGNAAVIGRRFAFDLLCSLLDEISEDECLALLGEARGASLIEPLADGSGWQFTHALIREALYDEMPAPRRTRLHQRIGAALEKRHCDDLSACLPLLAYHYHAARPAGGCAKAVEFASRAGEQATAALAHEEAARLYGDALQALKPGSDAQRCDLLLDLGDAHDRAGNPTAALGAYEEAAKLARRLGAPAALARAALGYETAAWRGDGSSPVACMLVKEALELNSALDSPLRCALFAAFCRSLAHSGRLDAATFTHRQAVAMARRLGDAQSLFSAQSAIVPAYWDPKLLPLRLEAGRAALQVAVQAGRPEWAVGHLVGWLVGDLMAVGDIDGAVQAAEFGAEAAAVRQQPFLHAVQMSWRVMIALYQGRFADAERLADEARRHAARFDIGNAAGASSVQMFTLRREQGRLAELAPLLDYIRRSMPDSNTWLPGYAVLCCELGRHDDAAAAFERLAGIGFMLQERGQTPLGSIVYLAEVCDWLGHAPRAAQLYQLLLPYAGRNTMFGSHVMCAGSADRPLGMLAATMQRWDDAEAHFERAIAFDAACGSRPWLAHSRCRYAAMLLERKRAGDVQRAAALLDAALQASRELGMHALEQRVLALQQPAPRGERDTYPAGLSSREVQVLRMVVEGKTNQDIANALFRSPNTVANHVRNILAKIDAANRTEAAAFAVRHGLVGR